MAPAFAQVVRTEAALLTRQLLSRGDALLSTSTCGNCWDDVPESEIVSLCGGRCGFGFCTSCAAKTYQLLGRVDFLASRGGPQQCRGLQCDGCRAATSLSVVQSLKTLLQRHQLLSDAGAEANEGSETDLALLNTVVALRGCERAELLITRHVDESEATGQVHLPSVSQPTLITAERSLPPIRTAYNRPLAPSLSSTGSSAPQRGGRLGAPVRRAHARGGVRPLDAARPGRPRVLGARAERHRP